MNAVALESPYKGLRPFEATAVDARLFFGRERERELIAANLVAARLTVLYGESGVGKSSVLRAGVVQTLREQARAGAGFAVALYTGWSDADPIEGIADAVREAVADVVGSDPGPGSGSLAERLAGWADVVAGDVYLVLDQVDEYFLYHGWHGGPLLDVLPELVTSPGLRVNTLLGIREDALARLDVFKARIPGLFANALRLERLEADAARAAIVGPLERWRELEGRRVEIEPALVDAILASVTVGPEGNGAAAAIEPPYLQVVMERLWDAEREAGSDVLRLETLERLGGGRRIVAEHLDRALAGLTPAEQDTAAAMFSQLVTPSGAKVAYDVADLAGYASADEAEIRHVADALMAERILRPVTGRGESGRVEIYHDVLASAAGEWRRRHDAQRALEAEREAARRRHRRLLAVAIVALLALAAMTAVAAYAIVQQRSASEARQDAGAREQAALALGALPASPIDALASAVDASTRSSSPAVAAILRTVFLGVRQTGTYGDGHTPVNAAVLLGRQVVTGDELGRVTVYRPDGSIQELFQQGAPVDVLQASPHGLVVAGMRDGSVRLWRLGAGRLVATLHLPGRVVAASFGPDDRLALATPHAVGVWDPAGRLVWRRYAAREVTKLALGSKRLLVAGPSQARLLDARSGKELALLRFPRRDTLFAAAYTEPLGLVATGHTRVVRLWDARTSALVATLTGHTRAISDLAFGRPDEPLLASASTDGSVRLWSPSRVRGRTVLTGLLSGHTLGVKTVEFGPGEEILTTSTDRTARVWTRDGQTLAILAGHTQPATGGELAGHTALTWSPDGTARTWAWAPDPQVARVGVFSGPVTAAAVTANAGLGVTAGGAELITAGGRRTLDAGPLGRVRAVALSADGSTAATGHDRGAALWDVRSGARRRLAPAPGSVSMVALGPSGRVLVTGGGQGMLHVFGGGGATGRAIETGLGTIVAGAVSPDGRYVGAGDSKGAAGVWELSTGNLVSRLTGHADAIAGMAFSAGSRLVGTASYDHDARIWRVSDGRLLHELPHGAVASGVAFGPDGRWVATAGPERAVIWDLGTGNQLLKLAGAGDKGRFLAVAFSPDGLTLHTVENDGDVGSYRCVVCGGIDDVRAAAEARLRRLSSAR